MVLRTSCTLSINNHVTMDMKAVGDSEGRWKILANPAVIRLRQIYHHRIGIQHLKLWMLTGIRTQIVQFPSRQEIQYGFSFEVVNASIVVWPFLMAQSSMPNTKSLVARASSQAGSVSCSQSMGTILLCMSCTVLTGACCIRAMCGRCTQGMLDSTGTKPMALLLFRANKIVHPNKPVFTMGTVHPDAGYAQVGLLFKHLKMPDFS